MRTIAILGLAGLLSACGGVAEQPATPTGEANAVALTPVATPSPAPSPVPAAKPSKTAVKNANYSFEFAYPAQAAAIPALAKWFEGHRAALIAELDKDTAAFRKEAADGDFEFRPYESTHEWKVVTDTPRFLSLSAETWVYTGGAHGSPGYDALVWDKAAGQRLKPTDVFASADAIQRAIGAPFCAAIDKEREKRRGAPVVRSDDSFDACPKAADATLILGSTDRQKINRIGLLVGPYVAGPYAEGTFEVTLPVTDALLAAVKPAYQDAFGTK
ncbi:DUF4163 domain-containing protein [uncultured Sphingomonas sp.]|uniref:DUF4163 domain-containing protein n=1 Tax=uncultured Sphingomonas sp. TaxID=158754 RepID=UPI0025D1CBBB|nr:DUF4163 domain-containing protein [uncultured Sphingomonas sp.]